MVNLMPEHIHDAIAQGLAEELGVKCEIMQPTDPISLEDWYWLSWKTGKWYTHITRRWKHHAIIIVIKHGKIRLANDRANICDLADPDLIQHIKKAMKNTPGTLTISSPT